MRKTAPTAFLWLRLVLILLGLTAAALSQTLSGPWSMRAVLLAAAVVSILEAAGEIDPLLSHLQARLPRDPVEFGDFIGNVVVSAVVLLGVLVWLW